MHPLARHFRHLLVLQSALWGATALAFVWIRNGMPESVQLSRDPATFGSPDVLWLGGLGVVIVPLVLALFHGPAFRVERTRWLLLGNGVCTAAQAWFWLYGVHRVAVGELFLPPWSGRLMAAGSLLGVVIVVLGTMRRGDRQGATALPPHATQRGPDG